MDDFRSCPREFISQFIQTYKANPCLWQVDTLEYRDKKKRKAGYEALLELMKTFYEEVTIEDVKKRINTIRTCYNRERRKFKNSLKGKPAKVYVPSLWYYDDMSFLEDVMTTPTASIMDHQSDDGGGTDDEVDFHKIYVAAQNDSEDSQPSSPTSQEQKTRKRPLLRTSSDSPPKKIVGQKSLKDVHADYDDEFDTMGKGFANKLRRISKLSRERVGIAEKLINDVLFQAEFVDISMDARIVNAPHPPKDEW